MFSWQNNEYIWAMGQRFNPITNYILNGAEFWQWPERCNYRIGGYICLVDHPRGPGGCVHRGRHHFGNRA